MPDALANLLIEIDACQRCAGLPLGPGPVLRASAKARLLIAGQAPGTKAHLSKKPWNDRSGDVLRSWLNLKPEVFYDPDKVAIVPMGFCYPGRDAKGGDLPPRPECRSQWHGRLLPLLSEVRLALLVGAHAQRYHLGSSCRASLTETVQAWRDFAPRFVPLPHPSWRNTAWVRRHPWFDAELLPVLRRHVAELLA